MTTKNELLAAVRAKSAEIEALIASAWPAVVPLPPPTPAPVPAPSGIAAADIICRARPDQPFAAQQIFWAQAYGINANVRGVLKELLTEAGIHGAAVNGDTVRFGKVIAPDGKPAFQFALAPGDPITNGSHRSEIEFPKNIEHDKTYWFAFRIKIEDWGTLPAVDESFFGTQIHTGEKGSELGGPLGFCVRGHESGGRSFHVFACHSTPAKPREAIPFRSTQFPISFGRYSDFVGKIKQSQVNGLLQVWMDGLPIVSRAGPFGLATASGIKDYFKFGYYNWTAEPGIKTPRKVLMRSMVVVADPSGKYSPEALRAFINQ